jgi:WD40 repeat protein
MLTTRYVRPLFLFFCFLGVFLSGCLSPDGQLPQAEQAIHLEDVTQLQPLTTLGEGQALDVEIAANGRWMAVRSTTGTYLYDTQTWSRLDIKWLQKPASQMVFSPDGRFLALALPSSNEIQIWQVPEMRLMRAMPIERSTVLGLIFTPHGERLISNSFQAINVWRVNDGALLQSIQAPGGTQFLPASLSADGTLLGTPLLGNRVNTILFWRLEDDGTVAEYKGGEDSWFSAGKFWPVGDQYGILVGETRSGGAGKLLVLHSLDGRVVREINAPIEIPSAAWLLSKDGSLLITGHANGEVVLRSSETGKALTTLPPPLSGPVKAMQIDPAGSRLVTVYTDGRIGLWSLPDGKLERTIAPAAGEVPTQIVIHPDGRRLIAIMPNGLVQVWDMDMGQEIAVLEDHTAGEVRDLAFSPNGQLVAAGLANGLVRLWPTNDKQANIILLDQHARVDSIAFSPDGEELATGVGERISALAFDDTVRVWEWKDTNLLWQVAGEQEDVPSCTAFRNRVAFSPDGSLLAANSHDFSVQVWDMQVRMLRNTLIGHTEPVLDMTISSDGSILASASLDGTIRLWRLSDGSLRRIIQADPLGMAAVAFSPDGHLLASGSLTGELSLWDAVSGRLLRKMDGEMNTLSTLAFSSDGSFIAAGEGSDLHLWSVETGKLMAMLPGDGGDILSVAFSQDGALLAFGSDRGSIQLWKAP